MPRTAAPATRYKICGGVLGQGAYGTVVKALNVETREYYAIKRCKATSGKVVCKPGMLVSVQSRPLAARH